MDKKRYDSHKSWKFKYRLSRRRYKKRLKLKRIPKRLKPINVTTINLNNNPHLPTSYFY